MPVILPYTQFTQDLSDIWAYSSLLKHMLVPSIWSLNSSGGSSPGRPCGETRVRLLKRRWGQKEKVSRKPRPTSEAPTTTMRALMVTCKIMWCVSLHDWFVRGQINNFKLTKTQNKMIYGCYQGGLHTEVRLGDDMRMSPFKL